MKLPPRTHPLWYAHMLHRLSGLALVAFLPAHFWVLSQALVNPARLDSFLAFAEIPAVKFAEFGLVFLLAVHVFGGMRLLALEFLPWPAPHKTFAAAALAGAFFLSGAYLLEVF